MFIVSAKLSPKKAIAGVLLFGALLIAIIWLTSALKGRSAPGS